MSVYPNFCGQSYQTAYLHVDAERSLNLFPEVINIPGVKPKAPIVMRRKPGLALMQTVPDTPGRGKFSINGRDFAVAGGTFYECLTATTGIVRGTFPTGTSPVVMKCNTVEVMLLADGKGYIFNLATNAFVPITSSGFPANVDAIESIDTYFIALEYASNQFVISSPLAGLVWSALDFSGTEEPDDAVSFIQCHLYLWIFGTKDTIIFQDSGISSFPFTRVPGSQIEIGCAAVRSPAIRDNTVFWLGCDDSGPAVVYRADGFLPTRISTHAMEQAMESYPTVADAISSTVEMFGHFFYNLHFPSANGGKGACWSYDVAGGGMWHEVAYWDITTGTYLAPLERFHSFCFGKHLVSDYRSGNIYELSMAYATDAGAPIRWLRAAPDIGNFDDWTFYDAFEVRMQTGGAIPSGLAPVVSVRWSNDGGFTWNTPRQISCGAVGEYQHRMRTNRCGRAYAQNRVFEISGTDPLPLLVISGASLYTHRGIASSNGN